MNAKFKKMFVLCTIILTVIMNPRIVEASVELSPNVTLSSGICPQVTFDCTAVDLPSTTLRWFIDDDIIASYPYIPTHQFPYNETILISSPWTDVVMIQIVNASYNENDFDKANFYSTLTTNLSALVMLGGNNIRCGSTGTRSNNSAINLKYIEPPRHPVPECSLVISPGNVTVSSSFSSENSVTNYRVVASSTPSSCPSEQLLSPSENYSCSGLVFGTRYSFTVSAINCGNQEGVESTIIVHPQVPLIPEIVVTSTYDENSLSQLTVIWQVKRLSISDVCSFDNSLNYSIFLSDSRGETLEERVVNSDSCNKCSISFTNLSSSNFISVYAVNPFGRSNTTESVAIENSLQMEFLSPILTFEDCVTTLLCSSVLAEGPCVVQYGQDSSYENFDNHLNVSLNSPSPLPPMDASTQYYFLFEVRVNSTFYQSRRSFMTGELDVPLTDTNIGLLIMGVIFLILGIIIIIVWTPLFIKCNTANTEKHVWITSLVLLLVAVFLWLVSVCLWIAVGIVVGSQRNTCDSKWQSNRDNLIIAAFVLSIISLLLYIAAILVVICKSRFKKLHESKVELKELKAEEQPIDDDFGSVKPSQEKASKCQQCGSEDSFLTNILYCCDACGKSYCSLCSVNKAELPSYSNTFFLFGGKKRRVCDSCYKKCIKKKIPVHGPGVRQPSKFYQPASPQITSTQQAQTVTSAKNGSTASSQTDDRANLLSMGLDNQDGATEQSQQKITEKKFATEEPTWNSDTEVCEVCKKNPIRKFKRHHCRACGKCVCSPCSRNEAYLPYEPKKAQRVCYLCYDICKNQGIKIVPNTVTEESETKEKVPHDPPSSESTGSGPARSTTTKQPQKDGGPKESEKQEQKIQGESGNTPKETPHDTNQVEVTDTRSVANSQNEKSQQETTATPVSFGAEAPELDIHSPNVCHACKKKVTSREYCRACGKVVCKKCSKNEAYLQYYASTVMVCPNCHKESIKKGDSSKKETTL